MEGIAIISGVLSVIMIVTFFNMASRLKEIRDELFQLRNVAINFKATPSYWVDEYRAAKLLGDQQGMIRSLNMFVYYKVKQVPVNEKQSEFNTLNEQYHTVFTELGDSFPEWDKSIFK